jgi:hypothetical protein
MAKQLSLNHNVISTIERASIINDMFAFLRSGHLSIDTVFSLIEYVAGNYDNLSIRLTFKLSEGEESDRAPWTIIMSNLFSIENMVFQNTKLFKMLEVFILKGYTVIYLR